MSQGDVLLFAVLPYAAIAVFVVGTVWRYATEQSTWTSRSTQLLESRVLRWGSILFHVGALLAIGGHVLGILVPASFTRSIGISDGAYHVIAAVGGILAGLAATVGFTILVYRRVRFPRVRLATTRMDVLVFALLAAAILTGLAASLDNVVDETFYRESVAPWFRHLLVLDPEPAFMVGAAWILKVHVSLVWALYAAWPFSRLVHVWSIPVRYLSRSPIVYRGRAAEPVRSQT
jgi:nitrate reductase gamma subunit